MWDSPVFVLRASKNKSQGRFERPTKIFFWSRFTSSVLGDRTLADSRPHGHSQGPWEGNRGEEVDRRAGRWHTDQEGDSRGGTGHDRTGHAGEAEDSHPWEDHDHDAAGTGNGRGHHSTPDGEDCDHGTHRDIHHGAEGYSREADRDDHIRHQGGRTGGGQAGTGTCRDHHVAGDPAGSWWLSEKKSSRVRRSRAWAGCEHKDPVKKQTHIRNTADDLILEFLAIQGFNGRGQVRGGLELDKAGHGEKSKKSSGPRSGEHPDTDIIQNLPLAIVIPSSLGIDHIELGLSGKIFQVLDPEAV